MKVGIVGCGFMGRMHANVYSALGSDVTLAGVADTNPENAKELAEKWGVKPYASQEELIRDAGIDIVDICLPTYLHAQYAVAAAKAGKHVLCEKPMAISVAEADSMIAAACEANVKLMIAHCIRFWPEYAILKKLVDDRTLGALTSINLSRYSPFPSWSWQGWIGKEELSGGASLDLHIHDTDFALYLLGTPDSESTWGTVDSRGVSQIFTTLTFGKAIAHIEGGWNFPASTPFKMSFRAIFEKGAAVMDNGPLTIYEDGKDAVIPEIPKMSASGAGGNISDLGGYYHEIRYFIDCIKNNRPIESASPESARASLAVTLREIAHAKAGNS